MMTDIYTLLEENIELLPGLCILGVLFVCFIAAFICDKIENKK